MPRILDFPASAGVAAFVAQGRGNLPTNAPNQLPMGIHAQIHPKCPWFAGRKSTIWHLSQQIAAAAKIIIPMKCLSGRQSLPFAETTVPAKNVCRRTKKEVAVNVAPFFFVRFV
ncbi:MAG: hypothetical protein H6559_20455 [Lewinellaceae bacterium]|nr:hypothetical protein [Lewinellaceae bacterium]